MHLVSICYAFDPIRPMYVGTQKGMEQMSLKLNTAIKRMG